MTARCVDCLNEAIERCELTGVPLCAEHLWYAGDGRRVSERVARQLQTKEELVYSPQHYLREIGGVIALPRLPSSPRPAISTQRNGSDVVALLSLISGAISIATCFGVGIALCLPPLPILPLVLGLIGLTSSKSATRPEQARIFSWVGIVAGAGFLLIALLLAALIVIGTVPSFTPTIYAPGPAPTVFPPVPTP